MLPDLARQLPIADVLDDIRGALSDRDELVLEAPPGAGKTTIVPLALLDAAWLSGRKILLLEPRRMAARAAAARMAQLLDELPGATVGYRIRLDTCVSASTRIEVITEGILARRLQNDPGLQDVGLVIFDEFHERSLDSDLGLALTLQGRELFREDGPLKVLVMSATLDGSAVSELLGNAPLLRCAGRQYPVDVRYGRAHELRDSIIPPIVKAVRQALRETSGSILVFLPGQAEIGRAGRELSALLGSAEYGRVELVPLYGGLSLEQQQRAIRPPGGGARKIVLSTNIAETSLTIEGIETVIDSGLVREPVFDPATGMTRLTTRRVSRSSAEQRAGRAGRLGPGRCYRLWSEEQQRRLVSQGTPEILQADLAPMALQLLAWGVDQPGQLRWLDTPPAGPFAQAVDVLESCGAAFQGASGHWQLTPHGVRLAQLPLHPRLAHMLLVGCDIDAAETACLLAAVLSERNPMSERGADISITLALLMGELPCPKPLQGWFKRTWQQARRYGKIAAEVHKPRKFAVSVAVDDVLGVLLASAYPDRVARVRRPGDGSQYQLSNGRMAVLPAEDSLAGRDWLAVAELGGHQGESSDRIFSAVALNPACFGEILSPLVRHEDFVEWDDRRGQFIAERRMQMGQLTISAQPLSAVPLEAREQALLGVLRKRGLRLLSWTPALEQWRSRVMLLYKLEEGREDNRWPDLSDRALLETLEAWLLPFLDGVRTLEDFKKLDLRVILHALLPWPMPLELARLAPERIAVPSGSTVNIDYSQDPPVLAVKLQEMFGCADTPRIADGRIGLQLHLLSPAQRPLQVTQDLASFWRDSYLEVRKEMRGRYPKHPWPEDPINAVATGQTKRRLEAH
ncbi:ATP-dependent helicase HrpB [Halieaceae bacterium]|nr:ATP-dependent helicase HrpB [Halieaceae bacterium]